MFIEEMTQKNRSVAFGVPVSVPTEQRKRIMNDQYLFPREAGMFGNCAETNAWTTRPDLPIKSRTVYIQKKEIALPCKNCQACQN